MLLFGMCRCRTSGTGMGGLVWSVLALLWMGLGLEIVGVWLGLVVQLKPYLVPPLYHNQSHPS